MNRPSAFSYLELALVPLAFVLASLVFRALLTHAPAVIAPDLAQPLPVATTWHGFGQLLWLGAALCIFGAGIPYMRFIQSSLRADAPVGLTVILATGAAAGTCALTIPVIFSSDVYAYAAYGWMGAHGMSPYAHAAIRSHDPLIRAAIWQWGNPLPICVYGPVFVWIAELAVTSTHYFGMAAQILTLRIISSLALLACGPLFYLSLGGMPRRKRLAAVAGLLLNPVAIWIAAEGHNDTIVLAFVLCGFVAIRRFGYFIGSFIIATSALVKASGAAAAGVLALFVWPNRGRLGGVLGGFAAGILLTAVIAAPFESGIRTVLIPHSHFAPQFSAQFLAVLAMQMLFGTGVHALEYGVALVVIATGALALHGAALILKGEREGAAYIALALWLAIPNPYPWYAVWILPVAFLSLRSPASWAIIAASITIFARYLPDMSSSTNPDLNIAVTCCEIGLPLAILVARATWTAQRAVLE